MSKTAVLLLNLGGPDSLKAVRPFLYNIFNDPHILPLPRLLRHIVAMLIAWIRTPSAKRIYASLGGSSPLLAYMEKQSEALQERLGSGYRIFVAMRYWYPRLHDTLYEIERYNPDTIIILPLYPQYSTTTTASSLAEWEAIKTTFFKSTQTKIIDSYSTLPGFINSFAGPLKQVLESLPRSEPVRILFSAHGLPQYVVDKGDPYVQDVQASVDAIVKALEPYSFDWRLCYQSRVGPVKWLEPSIADEVIAAAKEGRHIVVVPISFVTECSETLYELDQVYRQLALKRGALSYVRLPTSGMHPDFIAGLSELCRESSLESAASFLKKVS